MIQKPLLAVVIVLLISVASSGLAAVRLGSPFGNHMVLQQGVPVPVWGSGCPGGDSVVVSVAGQSVAAKSDWAGRWKVELPPMKAGGPYQMIVSIGGSAPYVPSPVAMAGGGAEINDVVIGEVWLAVGRPISAKTKAEIPGPRHAWIRMLKASAAGQWVDISPDTVSDYSARAFAFAREQYDKLKVPIGIIDSAQAGLTPDGWLKEFAPCALRGVIWDEDAATARQSVTDSMMKDWRQALGLGDLPFLISPGSK